MLHLIAALSAVALPTSVAPQDKSVRVLPQAGPHEFATEFFFPQVEQTVTDLRRVLPDGRVERVGRTSDGLAVDVDALRLEDHRRELERFGRVDSTLRARLDQLAPGDAIEVAFWLLEPEDGFDPGRTISEAAFGVAEQHVADVVRAARADALRRNEARLQPVVAGFAAAVREAGGTTVVEGMGWPLVIASVDAGRVEQLAAHPAVDTAYVSQSTWAAEGDAAQGTMRTYTVHDQGVQADGSVRVMVNDVGEVQVGNPYLPPVTVLVPDFTDSHATGVAGNICNTHPTYFASSYTLPDIYSAPGTGDSDAPNVWATGITAGIDFGNCSWWNFLKGKIEFLDRFFDYTVRNFGVMMFKSNGNQGSSSTPYGTTPGNGYNVICTGNYNDLGDSNWANDAMTGSSSYWNPQEGHEKPEVASPGDCVATAGTGGSGIQSCFGGTSSASPLTCGVAALIASYDNTLLGQMTTVKAMLMASAWHNVEGAALMSEKDGAGGTHAKAAHALIRDDQWWHQEVTDGDFSSDLLDVPMTLDAGDETRVIALWFSNVDASYSTDVLDMDLDLTVLDPGGAVVASSASAVNSFELASFVPPVSGTYTVRLTKQRFDGVTEPLTVAWSTRNDTGTARVFWNDHGAPFSAGETPSFRFLDEYVGGGREYAAFAALSGNSAAPLPGGWALPIGFDSVSAAVLAQPGWIGTLNGAGQAQALLPIADAPGLAGVDVYFGLLLWPPGMLFDGPVEMVSDPLVLTIQP
ncbi:MAG: S8/S53 family peptidase [Planctomycetota bacterium]